MPSIPRFSAFLIVSLCVGVCPLRSAVPQGQWERHTIDDTSRGADGVKLADLNHDGLTDLTVGWEEGGVTRIYLHPGAAAAKRPWPSATIGQTRSSEDAVFVDLNGDRYLDVVSSCEGQEQSLLMHVAPADGQLLASEKWTQAPLPGSVGMTRWMFAVPANVHFGSKPVRLLFAGSKELNGTIGFWEIPESPAQLNMTWKWHPLSPAGWIMSVIPQDMDGDGDLDLFYSDRKGELRGVKWLENPGSLDESWPSHLIGGSQDEIMFGRLADLDQDGLQDVVVTAKPQRILWWRRLDRSGKSWELRERDHPQNTGSAKAVVAGDIDLDGFPDLVLSCEHADAPKQGVFWIRNVPGRPLSDWPVHGMSGPDGIKFDRIELLDVDLDGDLDVLTCEERHQGIGLGVFWYENPAK